MATEELEVVISPTGEVQVTARGFTGTSCLSATAGLEAALGGDVADRQMTDEAYRQQTTGEQEQVDLGGRRSW